MFFMQRQKYFLHKANLFSKTLKHLLTFQKIQSILQIAMQYLTVEIWMARTKLSEMGAGVKMAIMLF